MIIKFYKCLDSKFVLNKELTDELEVEGSLRDSCRVLQPSIMLVSDVSMYNYCYVPAFDRYYFIDKVTAYRKSAWIVDLSCDYYMSHKDAILALQARIDRVNEQGDNYLANTFVLDARTTSERVNFDYTFDDSQFILITRKKVAE